jgi:hypothetical protein
MKTSAGSLKITPGIASHLQCGNLLPVLKKLTGNHRHPSQPSCSLAFILSLEFEAVVRARLLGSLVSWECYEVGEQEFALGKDWQLVSVSGEVKGVFKSSLRANLLDQVVPSKSQRARGPAVG